MINKIKKMFGQSSLGLSHKNFAIFCGVLAQMLIVSSSVGILEKPQASIIGILYAFFVLLPMCYYNMRNHELEEGTQ